MVLRVIDINRATKLLYVGIVAVMRNESCEKELLKLRREIRIVWCVWTMVVSRVSFAVTFSRWFWQGGPARQVGTRIPKPGRFGTIAWSKLRLQPRCVCVASSHRNSKELQLFGALHLLSPSADAWPVPLPTLSGKRWFRACREWLTEIESEEVWKPRR